MTALVFFVEQIAPGLYIFIGIGLFFAWRWWRRSSRALRATHFELERDLHRYRRANALTVMILLVEFALAVLGVQRVVSPAVRSTVDTTQTIERVVADGEFDTPTPSPFTGGGSPIDPSGVNLGDEEIVKIQITPTLTPTPVGTILPNPPPVVGCDMPNATLQVPQNGMLVHEPINVVGTAFADNFSFYRLELKAENSNFAPLPRDYDQPVMETGVLGQFVPAFYQPGEYQFRLVVFDITLTQVASCAVNITISEPIPTPTPLGQ
ncbi:MAG: hypothetical protein H6672_19475 [Anaerolineaceae bacterium]|nr:hypothetical protein [Anaerolineaceae bacterium]